MSTCFVPNILNHSFCCAESALTLQWYTGHRTAQELTEETRAVSRPLRGVAPPAICVADGAVAGPSRARQFTGSPQQAPPREDQLQRPEPGPEVGPEAVRVQTAPVGAIQEPWQGSALNRSASNAVPESPARFSVVPLEEADLTRPPPPLPAWARPGMVPAPKIYSGVFHSCTLN